MRYASFWRLTGIMIAATGMALAGTGAALAASSAPRTPAGPAEPAVTAGPSSAFLPVSGHTLVRYGGTGGTSRATVSGSVTGLPAGASAEAALLVRPFGAVAFTGSGQRAALTAGPDGSAAYSFTVQPSRATSYEVQVSEPGGLAVTSAPAAVYVIPALRVSGTTSCSRPNCLITFTVTATIPPAAYTAESTKTMFLYRGIKMAQAGTPAAPSVLNRVASTVGRNSGDTTVTVLGDRPPTVTYQVSTSFNVGNRGYRWKVNYCTQDMEAEDGIGLPGHHGCGSPAVRAGAAYLG